MALYMNVDVCLTCPHATMHSCGSCLKLCAIGLVPDCARGMCDGYAGADAAVLGRIAAVRQRQSEPEKMNQKSDHGQGD